MRAFVVSALVMLVLVATGAAMAVGPWPGLAPTVVSPAGDVRYKALRAHGSTTVQAIRGSSVVASSTFEGAYGIPAVTSFGKAGGLSPDGRLLVLVQPTRYDSLRSESRFLLVSTGDVSLAGTIVLKGEFGFDAVSPDRRTLYLIQHVSSSDLVQYVVRAYDLRAKRLLARAIADKREPAGAMRGFSIARATSPGGAWVYTLYTRAPDGGNVFVHALNAAARTAYCIDLHWPQGADVWRGRLELSGRQLIVRGAGGTVARIDTRTFAVRY